MTGEPSEALIVPPDPPAARTGYEGASPGDLVADLDHQSDPVVLADMLAYARTVRQEWQVTEREVENRLAEIAGVGQHEPAPGTVFVVRQAADRTEWATDSVKADVCKAARQRKAPDPETGEILPDWEAVAQAIWAVVPASPSFRVGGLKALGLDVADYRTRSPGRRSVELI